MGNTLYFTADDGTNGSELWKTDGTSSGTVMVKDINSGSGDSVIYSLTANGNTLYFNANDGTNGNHLWMSDGTASGTVMVKDINSVNGNPSHATDITPVGNTIYFSATDGTHGYELWKSDGTDSGTVMVQDIRSGIAASSPDQFAVVGNTLFFRAYDGYGYKLWALDPANIMFGSSVTGATCRFHLDYQPACPSTAARAPSAAHQRLRRATRPTRSPPTSAT